jgi:hypothetical protein
MGLVVESSSSATIAQVSGYHSTLVGGLVGVNSQFDGLSDSGEIDGCSSSGSVEGYDDVGGLVGRLSSGTIQNSSSSASVTGHDRVGGLIGSVADSGTGLTATVEGCNATGDVMGNYYVGALIGRTGMSGNTVTINQCFASGSVGGSMYVGGLIGLATNTTVSESYADATMLNGVSVGGLVGAFNSGEISRCYTDVAFAQDGFFATLGGLVGTNYGAISDSYALGPARTNSESPGSQVGGLVGLNENTGTIFRCYSVGEVTGSTELGGLVGENQGIPVSDSFYDQTTSGMSDTGKGTPKTTAELTNVTTFTDTATAGLDAPWDFVGNPNDDSGTNDYWDISGSVNNGYPYLEVFE